MYQLVLGCSVFNIFTGKFCVAEIDIILFCQRFSGNTFQIPRVYGTKIFSRVLCAGLESECFGETSSCENLEGKAFLHVYKSVLSSKVREDSLVSSPQFGLIANAISFPFC